MIRNRIVDHILLRGRDLQDNAGNWRIHPQAQVDAVNAILANVGIVDELLIYNSERQGGWTVIDGHLRKDEHPDVEWPCTVVDLNDTEADAVLAAFDRLTAKAETDNERLGALIQRVQERDAALLAGVFERDEVAEILAKGHKGDQEKPELEISPELFERHDYLVFYFDNEFDWQVACERFDVKMVKSGTVGKRTIEHRGVGRVLAGATLLQMTG